MSRVAIGVVGKFAAAAFVVGAIGCSGEDTSAERSAESFCSRWQQIGEVVAAEMGAPRGLAGGQERLRDLADRSPDQDLTDVLEEMAELQPDWRRQVDMIESNAPGADEVDSELLIRFGAAAQEMLDGVHRVCD